MAKTTMDASNPLVKQLWEEQLFEDTMKESFFHNLMGEGKENIIQVKNDLTKAKGDRVNFGMVPRGVPNIRKSGQTLTGHETRIRDLNFKVEVDEHTFAVADDGPLSRQRAMYNMDKESKKNVEVMGAEYVDEECFRALYDTPTNQFFGGTATAFNNLTTGDLITPALISKIAAGAQDGWARRQTPLKGARVDGKDWFVMVVPFSVGYDVKQNTQFQNAWQNARERSSSNPLFTGVIGAWDNVLIKEHENCTVGLDAGAGSNVPYADCLFLGRQALCWAWAEKPHIVSEDRDFKREHAHSWQAMFGTAKPKFDTNNDGTVRDYGCVNVTVATTNVWEG